MRSHFSILLHKLIRNFFNTKGPVMKINHTKLIFCLHFFVYLATGFNLCGSTSDPRVGTRVLSGKNLKQAIFSEQYTRDDFDANEIVIINKTKKYGQIINKNKIPVLFSSENPRDFVFVEKDKLLVPENKQKALGEKASGKEEIEAKTLSIYTPEKEIIKPGAIVLAKEDGSYIYGKVLGIAAIVDQKGAVGFFDPTKEELGKFPKVESKVSEPFSLTAWSTEWFTQYKEYSDQIDKDKEAYPTNTLTWQQFQTTAQAFVEKHRTTDLGEKKSWMEDKALSPDFFDIGKYTYNWLPNGDLVTDDYKQAYVQKLTVDSGSTIFFIGDFHGSLHSLLRILWHFVAAGFLANNLEITKKNHYIIFNGDLVDRGRYSIEVLYTILQLKLKNWGKVFILRGNHEDAEISGRDGLSDELRAKYTAIANPHQFVAKIFEFFPMALYLGSGKDKAFVQCCHGGIEVGYNPENFLAAPQEVKFQKLGEVDEKHIGKLKEILVAKNPDDYKGFNWSDFEQAYDGRIWSNFERTGENRGGAGAGYLADVAATFKYLGVNTSIKAFFRGHQDYGHVFKMFFGSNLGKTIEDKIKIDQVKFSQVKAKEEKIDRRGCPNGPYNWHDVFSPEDEKEIEKNQAGFLIHKYVPVFTFTTATEARGLAHDSYGKLTTADTYEKWRLKPYEFELAKEWRKEFEQEWRSDPDNEEGSAEELESDMADALEDEGYRDGKYVQLVYEKNPEDEHLSVSVKYIKDPAQNPIPRELMSRVRVVSAGEQETKKGTKVQAREKTKVEEKAAQPKREIGTEASPEDKKSAKYDKKNVFKENEIVIIKHKDKDTGEIRAIYAKIITIDKAGIFNKVFWGDNGFRLTKDIGKIQE